MSKDNSQQHIVQVGAYYPPHLGGLEKVFQEVSEQLALDGYRVTVVTSDFGAKKLPKKEVVSNNLLIKRLWSFEFAHTAFIPGLLWTLLTIKKPTLFHMHMAQAAAPEFVWLAAKLRRIPYVIHFHLDVERSGKLGFVFDFWKRWVLPVIIKDAARIITLSQDQSELIHKRYGKPIEQIVFIGNGVGSAYLDLENHKRNFHKPLRLLFVGRLSIQKRVDRLIESLPLIKSNIVLDIVGDGVEINKINDLIKKLGLTNVNLRGRLDGQDLLNVYKENDVFVLPSDKEGMPLVLLEAMAAGLPVVGSDVMGIQELVKNVGVLVNNPSPQTFAEAIGKLASNPNLLDDLSKKSIELAQQFTWKKLVGKLEIVYKQITKPQIVIVTPYYPPHLGGIERVAKVSAEELARRGYSVQVITSDKDINKRDIKPVNNLQIKALHSFEFAHTPFTPTLFWHLITLPKNSLIHLHLAQVYYPELVWLVSKIRKIPYLIHFHLDVGPSGFFGRLYLWYKKMFWARFLRDAKMVVACSPDQINVIADKYRVDKNKISLVVNAVSEQFFASKEYEVPTSNAFKLLYIGRLAVQKRVERIIDAMALVSAPAQLTIVGDGEDRKSLEARVLSLGLKNVVFVGSKNDDAMKKYHEQSHLFVISSDSEGAALVLLEAMAANMPILGTNVSGIRDLVGDVGVLVDKPYAENIAKTVDDLWANHKKLATMSVQSREKAKNYCWKNFVDKLEDIYNKALT